MHTAQSKVAIAALVTALAFALPVIIEGVDVRVDHDKTFDFKPMRTWGWNPAGAGDVKMARSQQDEPEVMKKKAEPFILDAVAKEMPGRGLQLAASQPDLTVTYYLLLTLNTTAQTMGQFLPPSTSWALPPFLQSTQSLEMMNQGALVLDLSAKGVVVWRGVAQAKIAFDADDKKRETLLREGVRDLLKKYPPKN